MTSTKTRWAGRATALTALTATMTMAFSGLAFADNIQDDIVGTGTVTLEAGSSATGTANIRVVGNNSDGTTTDPGCNWDPGENPLVLNVVLPHGVTATPDPLSIKDCGTNVPVTFKAAADAVSGTATVSIVSKPAGGGEYNNQVSIPITINQPANTKPSVAVTGVTNGAEYVVGSVPTAGCDVTDKEDGASSFNAALSGGLTNGLGSQTATCDYTDAHGLAADTKSVTYQIVAPPNTKPSVAVTGVTHGDKYEIGSVPAAGCDVTDAEDGNSTKNAILSGTLSHGLGSQTATCDYTDEGGLAADTTSVTYTIVDTGDPTISHTLTPAAANANGWFDKDVAVDFTCDDSGSGIDTCTGDTTLGEGANQSATGTATDWAGNTATDTVTGINIDKTKPTVALKGGPADSYYFGNDPAAPTCEASDTLSGLDGTCKVTGGGSAVGSHTYTATATDKAGNEATATLSYTVLAWTTKGYYSPVDMGGVWNTVKGGSTVPLKFELFAGSTELTSTSSIASFTTKKVSCSTGTSAEDAIEIVTTGGTSLRYDSTGGQFIQNWKTPTGAGTCYSATMTAADGSTISALFKLK